MGFFGMNPFDKPSACIEGKDVVEVEVEDVSS
jgi:hypothetical protein